MPSAPRAFGECKDVVEGVGELVPELRRGVFLLFAGVPARRANRRQAMVVSAHDGLTLAWRDAALTRCASRQNFHGLVPLSRGEMEFLSHLIKGLRDLPALIQWAGYVGLTAIIFVETGLFFGFFLPGDSLLVTAGLLASQGFGLDVYMLGVLLNIAAIVGDNTNYWIGRYMGPRVFTREDSLFFRRRHVERAHDFYERNGAKTIVLARFMPIIRTFAPLVAGVARMSYRTFLTYSVLGGTAWIWSMLFVGYFLGRYIPGIDKHIEKVIIVVIFLSILPGIIGWIRERRAGKTVPG
jgi:membrane-associated protein